MPYTKKRIKSVIDLEFVKERSRSNKNNRDLYNFVKGRVLNEASLVPSVLALCSLFSFIPLYFLLGSDLALFISIMVAVGILFVIPYYLYNSIENPYVERDESKKEGLK